MSPYLINYLAGLLVTFSTTFGMALFVATRGLGMPAHRRFVVFNLSVAWWSFFQFLMALSSSYETACWANAVEHVSVVFISTFFLHFVYDLLEVKRRFWLRIHYTLSFLFLALIPTGLLINGVDTHHRYIPYMVEPGPLYVVMVAWFLAESTQGVVALFLAYFRSSGAQRNRMKYLAWGALIGYVGGCGNYLYVFDLGLPIFNPSGTYGVPIYVAMTAYAMIRHRLMDINVVIKKTLIYALLYSSCLGVFGFVVFFLGQWVVFGGPSLRLVLLSMVGLLIVVAMVRPLDRLLTRLTDRVLFGERYRYQQTLKAASLGMGRIHNLPKLLNLIARVIVRNVRVSHATVFLRTRQQAGFVVGAWRGRTQRPMVQVHLEEDNPLVHWLARFKKPVVHDELRDELRLERKLSSPDGRDPYLAHLAQVAEEMERLGAAVCIPGLRSDKLKGFLLLGEKLSGDMYTQEDLNIFSTLASQAALAVENAEAYEELRDTRDQLVQAERLATLGKFASDMAHEIKNPLQAIMTFFEFLPERYNDPNFRNSFSKLARGEVQRINQLVRELVTYTNPKAPNFQPVELHQVMDSVLELLENDFYRNDIDVRKHYYAEEIVLDADRDQLKQVFLNLFMNAVEAMPMKPAQSNLLELITVPVAEGVALTIRDSGCGIPEKQIPLVFSPFFTTKEKGTGLGLAIVQNILTAHHARIHVAESKEGAGTSISLFFPYRQPRPAAADAQVA